MLNTQEEGEDFEVHWISSELAAAEMTYKEDQEVIGRALDAIAQQALVSTPSILTCWLREQYLNPAINMSTWAFSVWA